MIAGWDARLTDAVVRPTSAAEPRGRLPGVSDSVTVPLNYAQRNGKTIMRRRNSTSKVLTAVALLALVTTVRSGGQAGQADGRLDLYFIDSEGGGSLLIVTPLGESVLVDSGYPGFDNRDRDRILHVVRDVAKLDHLDHSVVTHWHLDHFVNLPAVAACVRIDHFWDRGLPEPLPENQRFREQIAAYRAVTRNQSKRLRAGDRLPLRSGSPPLVMWFVAGSREVIPNEGSPNPFASLHRPKPEDKSENAESLCFLLTFGRFRFLHCADLTWNIEAKLVTPNNPLGQVDLFMVTHHGLPLSNNPVLVWAVDPRVAIMCNGPTKGGHPDVIKTIREVKSLQALYQLHRNIRLPAEQQAPPEFIANKEPTEQCPGVFIKVAVAPDGESYRVQIGERGRPRTYRTR